MKNPIRSDFFQKKLEHSKDICIKICTKKIKRLSMNNKMNALNISKQSNAQKYASLKL